MQNKDILQFSPFIDDRVDAYFLLNSDKISRKSSLDKINLNIKNVAIPEQIHSNKIKWVDGPGEYSGLDGLITTEYNLPLSLKVADCVPVYLFDSEKNIIALIHSGWKGTKDGIVNEGIKLMISKGVNCKKIKCYLGPSIGQCCYEVRNDVYKYFSSQSQIEINPSISKLDLKLEIKIQLESMGVLPQNINISSLCTYESNNCHSYRRDGLNSGRMYAVMSMRK
jgi:hypothetical protein